MAHDATHAARGGRYGRRMVTADEIDPAAFEAVDAVFAAFCGGERTPGISYGVVIDGAVVHAGAAGVATPGGEGLHVDSVLRIASMTKSFTAAAALALRDDGLLRLDEPVASYVPELAAWTMPTRDSPRPTIRMMLAMSAGLPTDDPWADREESMLPDEFSALLASGPWFIASPGTVFEYSNLGYAIVGRAIGNVAGRPYRDVVRTTLIEPLGLTSTGFELSDVPAANVVPGHHRVGQEWVVEPFAAAGEFSPIGGLFSSVRDLATWVGTFTDAFPARDEHEGPHPLSRASRREMQQLQRFTDVTVPPVRAGTVPVRAAATGYGFGLSITHDTRWGHIAGHSGGYPGYGSHMRWHPTTGVGVVALANGRYARAGEPAATALAMVLASMHAPSAHVTRWSRTREMQRAVQQLLTSWDDDVADRAFAANVDTDVARDRRRAEVQAVTAQLGDVVASGDPRPWSDAAADIAWWIEGSEGRARVEIMLTPQPEPLVQSLSVTFVGRVADALATAAASTAAELRTAGPSTDELSAVRQVGAHDEIECVAWENEHSATFRIRVGVDEWRAAIAIDANTGRLATRAITPTPPSAHRFDTSGDEIA